MNHQETLTLNKKLSKAIYKILESPNIGGPRLQDVYIKNFYEILRLSFDIHFTEQEFLSFFNNHSNDPIAQTQFITQTVEKPITYILINYYQINFLAVIKEELPEGLRIQVDDVLMREEICDEELQSNLEMYKSLTTP